jgi:UDPglucose 6-dehydrogenase
MAAQPPRRPRRRVRGQSHNCAPKVSGTEELTSPGDRSGPCGLDRTRVGRVVRYLPVVLATKKPGPLNLSVIGIGHMGLTHAVCMAEFGHQVLGLDADASKVAQAASGKAPFFEPGLAALLRKNLDAGRLSFTTSYPEAARFAQIHFICAGTPETPDGSADLSQVEAAADQLAPHLAEPCLVVGMSTVPVGTGRALAARIAASAPAASTIDLAWNPEFIREGFAVQDSLQPQRIVLGVTSQRSVEIMRRVYARPLAAGVSLFVMSLESAELAKISANSFLAAKLSYINALAEVCEAAHAEVTHVAQALAADRRIGEGFLAAGLGYGGGCLPKDVRAFRAAAQRLGVRSLAELLGEVDEINLRCRTRAVDLARHVTGGSLGGRRVSVLGIAFKPGIDDVRDSPGLEVCGRLVAEGAEVIVHDPLAMANAAALRPDLHYAESALAASAGADVVMHLTEWPEYRLLDPETLGNFVAQRSIVDCRRALDEQRWKSAGWSFHVMGR